MIFFINSFILSFVIFYVSGKVFKKTSNYKSLKYWLIIMINAVIITISFLATTHFLRVIFNYLVLVILNKIYFKEETINVITGSFLIFILIILSEMACVFLLVIIFKMDILILSEKFIGDLWINIIISFFLFLMVNIKKINFFFQVLFENKKNLITKNFLFLIILIIFCYSSYCYYLYLNNNPLKIMILGIALILIINSLIFLILKERVYSNNLKKEFEELIVNLNEYEKILEKYRMANHETKNNFIVLRDMVGKNKSNAKRYIDEIINHRVVDDEEILIKTKKFPIGGLQGLIYQKILSMKEKGILYNVEVSRNIDVTQFKNISFELNKDICTIVGVLIDNAIEAVEVLEKKIIGLYFYKKNNTFILSVSNTFLGPLNLDKLDNIGFSSKGKGRGYGLYLVKSIIDKNKQINIKREVIKDIFKQKIEIKM